MTDLVVVDAVICLVVACSLLTVAVIPPPSHAATDDASSYQALLVLGGLATVAMGTLALMDRPVEGAVCGALAWLLVMPCLWLLRAPAPGEEWGEEDEEDDGGGSPWTRVPPAPPAPDGHLPGRGPSGLADGRAAWVPARATVSLAPAASTAPATIAAACSMQQAGTAEGQPARTAHALTAEHPEAPPVALGSPQHVAAHAAREPAAAPEHRRLRAPARRIRGDHRSIVHIRADALPAGRRRRASLRRRVLGRCRRWLWPEPPECFVHVPFESQPHDARRHAPRLERELRDVESPYGRWGAPR